MKLMIGGCPRPGRKSRIDRVDIIYMFIAILLTFHACQLPSHWLHGSRRDSETRRQGWSPHME